MLTTEEISSALPPKLKYRATDEFTAKVNRLAADPVAAESFRENFISYAGVLRGGKFRLEDYMNAVVYVSYKLMEYSNRDAYAKTFPQRYQALVSKGADDKTISAHVSMYNKNKLVNLILDQSLIPTWVLNQDAFQKAINTQVHLMENARSEKVRSDAANSLLTHLKRPEKTQVNLNLGETETSGMKDLRDALTSLASAQQQQISEGLPTQEIAHQKLVRDPSSNSSDVIDAEVVSSEGPKSGTP